MRPLVRHLLGAASPPPPPAFNVSVRTSSPHPWSAEPELRFGAALSVAILVLELCAIAHATSTETLITVMTVVMLGSAVSPIALGALLGASSWAFYTGFVINAAGVLTFHHADVVRLALMVGVGIAAASTGHLRRTMPYAVKSGGSPWPTWSSSQ